MKKKPNGTKMVVYNTRGPLLITIKTKGKWIVAHNFNSYLWENGDTITDLDEFFRTDTSTDYNWKHITELEISLMVIGK